MFLGAMLAAAALLGLPAPAATLVAAGDIASCGSNGDEQTAALVARIPGTVAVLGDSVYERGTPAEFASCYAPSWGRFKARTRPAAGNHEYGTPGAAGYFGYFGPAAGHPDRGYHAYGLGAWRMVVLNSNCGRVGGCRPGSPQLRWLRAELRTNRSRCTLAYWHHPRQVRDWRTFGVLRLTLRPGSYDWRFVPVAGAVFTDAGSGRCH
jgi:hypothetical protein